MKYLVFPESWNLLKENGVQSHRVAGGACEGDIIFHEACLYNKIPTK